MGDSQLGPATQFTFSQIEQLWTQNGGPAGWAPLMAGIAIAESGGNAGILNNTPATGDYSVGLWQINYYGSLLSGRTAEYGNPQTLANDPNAQAKAAISLFGGGAGLSNWQGDATWKAWKAAGAPSQPSASTVQAWIGGKDTTGAGSAVPPNTGATGSGAAGAAGTSGSCTVNIFGACLLSSSELKAIRGGLLIVGGAILMGLGGLEIAMVAMRGSKTGRAIAGSQSAKVARKVVTKTPAGRIPGVNRIGAGAGTGRAPAPARSRSSKPVFSQRDVMDAFNAGTQSGAVNGPAQRRRPAPFNESDETLRGSNPKTPGQVRQMRQAPERRKAA